MAESRTTKSLKNAQVSFFYYIVLMILGFWSRKVFFDYLGSEVVGLETTAGNLLGFLNLAELGIGMSVTYFMLDLQTCSIFGHCWSCNFNVFFPNNI